MFLKCVTLKNIKKYKEAVTFSFEGDSPINTVSGKNGSGKSTIFDSIVLCQKAFFAKLLEPDALLTISFISEKPRREQVAKEFANLASDSSASISVTFGFHKEELPEIEGVKDVSETEAVTLSLAGENITETACDWDISFGSEKEEKILSTFWNLKNPTNIVVMLSADKNVYEDDFSYQKINMISGSNQNPAIDFIMDPRNIYQHLYDIMFNAYVYQRINPQRSPRDEFVTQSKAMFSSIIQDISVSNFSGKQVEDQLILQARNNGKYDVRNLSSGEKLVWYVVLVLNYIKNMGLLIIDEPENHLHEQLAWKLVLFLQDLITQPSGRIRIGQVFLITHAKNLIYNNFSIGSNYLLDAASNQICPIQQDECESVLRSCGISFIEEKILFVEGKTEQEHLGELCARENIKLKQLANCTQILQVYKSLLKVKELVAVPKFIFMLDHDTRSEEEIQKLRDQDAAFYDSHIVILQRHEIENYLLDENVIAEVINRHLSDYSQNRVQPQEILQKMKELADGTLEGTKKKYINYELDSAIKSLSSLVNQRAVNIESKDAYTAYVNGLLSENSLKPYLEEMAAKYDTMAEKYSIERWEADWKALCDGKIVFHQLCSALGSQYDLSAKVLQEKVFRSILKHNESAFMRLWQEILQKL